MSEHADTIGKHIDSFKAALAACRTRDECARLWKAHEAARADLCIVPSSYVCTELYALWVARGKDLAAQEKAA